MSRSCKLPPMTIGASPLRAQEPAAPLEHKTLGPADIIMPHITDSKHLELPRWRGWSEWGCDVTLPTWNDSADLSVKSDYSVRVSRSAM